MNGSWPVYTFNNFHYHQYLLWQYFSLWFVIYCCLRNISYIIAYILYDTKHAFKFYNSWECAKIINVFVFYFLSNILHGKITEFFFFFEEKLSQRPHCQCGMAYNFRLSISKRFSRHAFLAKLSDMIRHYPRSDPGKSPTSSRFFGMGSSLSAFLALVSRAARAQCTADDACIFDSEWFNRPHEHNSVSSLSAIDLHLQRFYLEYLTKTQEARDASPRWAAARAVSKRRARDTSLSR